MNLPDAVRDAVEAKLGTIEAVRGVEGGSINEAVRVEVGGGTAFLKFNPDIPGRVFRVEAAGLDALRVAASGLHVPAVRAVGTGGKPGWLALEWLEPSPWGPEVSERLAGGLAALHRAPVRGWGWEEDGYIGSLPQSNTPTPSWPAFWWKRRLEPQLRLCDLGGGRPGEQYEWEQLARQLPALLAAGDEDGPSLVHGDFWRGNVLSTEGGEPALVDPAVYRGHREVDLAMSELFGGFDSVFYDAYRERWPLRPGYEEVRRHVYQLYYLLVHVNLFGGSYRGQVIASLRRVLAAT
jgi:fructosamine-3-kinase